MVGRDASANLGGMLSQIGGTLGSMGQAGQGLMRPIMTSFRPDLDPNSVESLQRQAAFQSRIGDTEQARLFTGQAEALEERQRELQLIEDARIGQTAVANIKQRMNEVLQDTSLNESQRTNQLASLQTAANRAASQYGLNPLETAGLATSTQREYNTALIQQGQIRDRIRAEEQEAKSVKGQAAIANISQAVEATLADETLDGQTKQARLAALQTAANNAATFFDMGADVTRDLVKDAQTGFNSRVAQEENNATLRRQNERALGVQALERAQASGNQDDIDRVRKSMEARGYGDLLRQYDAGMAEYEDKMRGYEETIQESGPLTDEEIALAKELGVSDNELATWKQTPKSGRTSLRQRAQSEAAKNRSVTATKALSYGVVKDAVPGVLRQLEREGSQWFDFFDKDVEDLAGDILDNEDALADLAALAAGDGVTDVEGIRNIVLEEMRRRDSSIWQAMGAGTNAVDEFLGTETRTVNGKQVTIRKKGS